MPGDVVARTEREPRTTGSARRRLAGAALLLAVLIAAPAPAGQVRVDVGAGGQAFTPYAVNINSGDHVVWVWVAGSHTVTSWTATDSANFTFSGSVFDSDQGGNHFGQSTTTRFSWKSATAGIVRYVCVPHLPDMSGRIIVSPLADPPTIAVSDFRITEVQFNVPGGQDLIEITNLGGAQGNLGRYRLAVGATPLEFGFNNYPVPAGGRVVVHLNQSGANNFPNIFVPGANLPDAAGSLGLYVPSTLSQQNALTNASLMIDFVQWGAPGQANETTANIAGFWTAGTSINGVAAGHSIEYCANATLDHGIARWAEVNTPNFGTNGNCATPVLGETWARRARVIAPGSPPVVRVSFRPGGRTRSLRCDASRPKRRERSTHRPPRSPVR
jgi:plastocyanin